MDYLFSHGCSLIKYFFHSSNSCSSKLQNSLEAPSTLSQKSVLLNVKEVITELKPLKNWIPLILIKREAQMFANRNSNFLFACNSYIFSRECFCRKYDPCFFYRLQAGHSALCTFDSVVRKQNRTILR